MCFTKIQQFLQRRMKWFLDALMVRRKNTKLLNASAVNKDITRLIVLITVINALEMEYVMEIILLEFAYQEYFQKQTIGVLIGQI